MSRAREKRDEEIYGLYQDRYTLQEIGERFNITRQRVHQILKKYKAKLLSTPVSVDK